MKKWLIKFWYLLPILMIVFMLFLWVSFSKEPTIWENVVFVLLLLTAIALFASWIFLADNGQWWKAITSFLATAVIAFFLGIPLCFVAASAPTNFGKKHPIPAGLAYELPLPMDSCLAEPVDSLNTNTYLTIWNGIQGGIYRYDFYYGPLPAGEIYLKCYEVTDNYQLSEYRLTKASRVKFDTTTSFSKLADRQQFTIYEGDWNDFYAARIEVWYKNAATKEEKKLAEKVYRVEGWMR